MAALLCCHWWGKVERQSSRVIFIFCLFKRAFPFTKDTKTGLKEHPGNDTVKQLVRYSSALSHRCVPVIAKLSPLGSCLLAAVRINNRLLWVSNENAFTASVFGRKLFQWCYRKKHQVSECPTADVHRCYTCSLIVSMVCGASVKQWYYGHILGLNLAP